jgi:hypothetical protein
MRDNSVEVCAGVGGRRMTHREAKKEANDVALRS